MTPDHKYMPRAIDNSNTNKDLQFSKFNMQPPFNTSTIGWVPIIMFENPSMSGLTNNFPPLMPNNSLSMQPGNQFAMNNTNPNVNLNQTPNYYGNIDNLNPIPNSNQPTNTYYGNMNSSNPNVNLNQSPNSYYDNMNNSNNSNLQYPDESNDDLYSYNTVITPNKNISHNTSNNSSNSINQDNMNNSSMGNYNLSNIPTPSDVLRILDLNLEEDVDLDRHYPDKEIGKIFKHIQEECPGIINVLCEYNIPEPIYKLLIKRVIKLSLNYCKRE